MRLKVAAVLAVLAAGIAAPAVLAQERAPAQPGTLSELSYVLGQSHRLRQLCSGEDDQYWRAWMERLLASEAPDEALDRLMRDNFNAGYFEVQARFPYCTADAKAETARAAARGRRLARAAGGG